ncbi:alpha/beta hydrolase fold domain-containing protein [Streptomyces sp. NPDC020362]|uniref:alpha/beta hydrolase fold domain-containing protein n=1 Tax=unclassified Streptomyces TaxID=2593676 RepID=UPI0034098A30
MSLEQRETVKQILRDSPFDLGGEVSLQRPLFEQMLTSQPLPGDVITTPDTLGGVPVVHVDIAGARADGVVLHLHGGGYAVGSARASASLAAQIARRSGTRVVAVDYRLAPEDPFPAALDDALAAYRALLESGAAASEVAIAGESAGGGLAVALLAEIEAAGLPRPCCAAVFSPWADLTVTGDSYTSKAEVDPSVTACALRTRARDYAAGTGLNDPRLSPVHADLTGLPPLLVQAGSHEVLLDDALRLAARAAADDVAVTLEITPGVPHVFQAFAVVLDEAGAALDRASAFLRAHLRP